MALEIEGSNPSVHPNYLAAAEDAMSDERPEPDPVSPEEPSTNPRSGSGYTPGGYAYEVVGAAPAARAVSAEAEPVTEAEAAAPREKRSMRVPLWGLFAAVAGTAVIVGVAVWFIAGSASDDGGGDERLNANVGSVINAFTQGQAPGTLRRFDGALPPGYPADLPVYENAEIVSSLVQINDDDALFLAVYDTADPREDVAAYYKEALDTGDFQVDATQDGRESTIVQFTRTDDADVSGVVLVTESAEQDVTTIFYSVEVISGADDVDIEPFEPRVSRPLPEGFPDAVPQYPDAVVIETVFQRDAQNDVHGVAFITRDTTESVLEYYREEFDALGWTVSDADVSQSTIEEAQGINFESEDGETTGSVIAGAFEDDRNYSRVELQVRATR